MGIYSVVTLKGIYKVYIGIMNEVIKKGFRFYVVTEEAMKLTTSNN